VTGFARLLRQPLAGAGFAIVAAFVALAILAPWLPLADPDAAAPMNRLAPAFAGQGLLGTDQLGRDMLARLVFGLRVSLAVGAVATIAAALAGSAIGLVAAYYGKLVDGVLMRLIDVLMAFPYLLLALAVVAALGPGLTNAALAIAVVNVPFFARAARGAALGIVGRDYVAAARMAGFSDLRILATEVLPNVLPLIVVTAATTIGWMILETAGLSFLGLGAQPPQADLGSMLGNGRKVFASAPHVAAAAGATIFLLAVGLNLLGDGLRDLLDPRLGDGRGAPAPATTVDRRIAPEGSAGALLSVEGLVTAFETGGVRRAAVCGLDLSLAAGGTLGIVGESGSGKSVAALSLTRLAPSPPAVITAGMVAIDGEDVISADYDTLRRMRGKKVAYVFQDPSTTLNPVMTVGAQIAEAVAAHRDMSSTGAADEARKLIAAVGLPAGDRAFRAYPHQLSGGQRQRVSIAMALANDPAVLIADEPTTALDATTQARVLGLFRGLREQRDTALIFVSHDFSVIRSLCADIIVMYAGEVVEQGPTEAVLTSPRHPYTARLIACAPVLGQPDRVLDAIPGAPPTLGDRPDGCAFAPRCRIAIGDCRKGLIPLFNLGEGRAGRCIRTEEVADGRF
jgi:peptide/nickel transport system permease protein